MPVIYVWFFETLGNGDSALHERLEQAEESVEHGFDWRRNQAPGSGSAGQTRPGMSGGKETAWVKPVTDFGPIAAFFLAYIFTDLMVATAVLMAATAVALALAYGVERRLAVMPLITAAIIGVFGGLTLWSGNETFIKMKPTIVQALFAFVLLGGLAFGKPLLRPLMNAAWPMDDAGWRKLTFRFGLFFAAMAILNEIVWRTQSTDFWVSFKVFGILGLTLVFSVSQLMLLQRHHDDSQQAGEGSEGRES